MFSVYAILTISTLAMSGYSLKEGRVKPRFYLPNEIADLASVLLYIIFAFSTIILFSWLKRRNFRTPEFSLYFPSMYFAPGLHAIATGQDQLKYFSLVVLYLATPITFLHLMRKFSVQQVLSAGRKFALLYITISSVFALLNFGSMFRLSGFQSNPNAFGMILFFITILFFTGKSRLNLFDFVVLIIIFSLISLSGSRAAAAVFIFACITIFLHSHSRFKTLFTILIIAGFLILSLIFNDYYERLTSYNNAFEDSGRALIIEKATPLILQNPIFGLGADAPIIFVDTGNLHNSYLRLALMFGIPILAIFLSIMTYYLFRVASIATNYHLIKIVFFAIPVLYIGEDYVVGLNTAFFVFTSFFIALLFKTRTEKRCIPV